MLAQPISMKLAFVLLLAAGNLYAAQQGTPIADFVPLASPVATGTPIFFDGSPSFDTDFNGDDPQIVTYDFHIRPITAGPEIRQAGGNSFLETTIDQPGEYEFTLVVTDNEGLVSAPRVTRLFVIKITPQPADLHMLVSETKELLIVVEPANQVGAITLRNSDLGLQIQETTTAADRQGGIRRWNITSSTLEGRGNLDLFLNIMGTGSPAPICVVVGPISDPTAVAATPTPLIPVGGTATLDGSGSADTDAIGSLPDLGKYAWTLKNLTNPAQPDITIETTQAVINVTLNEAGEYDAELVVTDLDCAGFSSAGSSAHVNLKVVAVTLAPDPVQVVEGAQAPVTASVVPGSAATSVSFRCADQAIAGLDAQTIPASPGTLNVMGVAPGSTTVIAEIPTQFGWARVGQAGVTVAPKPVNPPQFSASPLLFRANLAGQTLNVSGNNVPAGATAAVESSAPAVFGFGAAGAATEAVSNGDSALSVRGGVVGTADLTLVITSGTSVTRVAGPTVTVSAPEVVLTLSPSGRVPVGTRITVNASATFVPANARVRVHIAGYGAWNGPASGFSFSFTARHTGVFTAAGSIQGSAGSGVTPAAVSFTVVGIDRVRPDFEFVTIPRNGSETLTFTGRTAPAGNEDMIAWAVFPTNGVSPQTGSGRQFTATFTEPGFYLVAGTVGTSEEYALVFVMRRRR